MSATGRERNYVITPPPQLNRLDRTASVVSASLAGAPYLAPDTPPNRLDRSSNEIELSVVIPCLNEADTLAECVEKAQRVIAENHLAGEVIVADNGSTDGSLDIAARLGARIVNVPARGYGSALMGGIAAAHGRFII